MQSVKQKIEETMREFTTVRISNEFVKLLKLRAIEEQTSVQDLVENFVIAGLKLSPDQITKSPATSLPAAYARLPELIAAPRHRQDKLLLEMLRITLDTFDDSDEEE